MVTVGCGLAGPHPAGLTTSLLGEGGKARLYAYAGTPQMMYYNFVRIHQKLRVTPAMAAGATDKLGRSATLQSWSRMLKGRQRGADLTKYETLEA